MTLIRGYCNRSKPIQREHAEQVALFRWLSLNSAKHPAFSLIFAIPNGGHRHPAVASKLKAEGVKAGVPDIFVPWPKIVYTDSVKHGLFIEMKAPKGKLSIGQSNYMTNLRLAGYKVRICFGWIDAANTICEYLELEEHVK